MKKTAIIAPNSLPVPPVRGGGIQAVIAEITPLFREFKPYVFSNCEYGIDRLPLAEAIGNVEYRRICQSPWDEFKIKFEHLTTLNYFPYVLEIIEQIKELQPDVIEVMNRPWFLPILRKYLGKDAKIILHHFNNYLMEMPAKKAKMYLDLADAFIGCSDFTVEAEVLKRFPDLKNKAYTVSNGIDPSVFDPEALDMDKIEKLREKYGINSDDIIILYVGRLTRDKGAGQLLEAVKVLVANLGMKPVKLMIVGSSFFGGDTKITPFIKELKKSALDIKDNIIFTGFINRTEMPAIYGLANIVTVPSIVLDASPMVCYEASSMALPVIGTRRGGIPELINEGQTGFLVDDPENIDDLVEKLLFFVKRPEESKAFGKRGRLFIKKNFAWDLVAQKNEKVYEEVLRR